MVRLAMPRDKLLQIKLSEREKEKLEEKARKENFSSVSEWARKILLDRADA